METRNPTTSGTYENKEDDSAFVSSSEAFISWFLAQPGTTINPDISIADYRDRGAGRGIRANKILFGGTELFRIPYASLLSARTSGLAAKAPELFQANANEAGYEDGRPPDEWTKLLLALIYEHQLGTASPWYPYLAILPSHFNTLMFWKESELAELRGCDVLKRIGREEADKDFRERVIPLIRSYSEVFFPNDKNGASQAMDDETLLALAHRLSSTIMAYAFDVDDAPVTVRHRKRSDDGYDNEDPEDDKEDLDEDDDRENLDDDDDDREDSDDGYNSSDSENESNEDRPVPKCMVPLADLLNADFPPNARLLEVKDKNGGKALAMFSLRKIRAGHEIFNDYGKLPRADLLRRYGYMTPQYDRFDRVGLRFGDIIPAIWAHQRGKAKTYRAKLRLENKMPGVEANVRSKLNLDDDDTVDVVWPPPPARPSARNISYIPDTLQTPRDSESEPYDDADEERWPPRGFDFDGSTERENYPIAFLSEGLRDVLRELNGTFMCYIPKGVPMADYTADIRGVILPVLRSRLEQYNSRGSAEESKRLEQAGRRSRRFQLAVELRRGEMELLEAAIAAFEQTEPGKRRAVMLVDDDATAGGRPASKKRKLVPCFY